MDDVRQGSAAAQSIKGARGTSGRKSDEDHTALIVTYADVLKEQSGTFMQALSNRYTRSETLDADGTAMNTFDSVRKAGGDSTFRRSMAVEVTLRWEDLQYSVRVGKFAKKRDKLILHRVSGCVPAGRLLAIMGPTGCGKTSLINALAGRLPAGGTLSGSILVNGQARSKAFKNISAYVMQDDVLFSMLTVRETFEVAADLRLPSSVPKKLKESIVNEIIMELGLSKAANTCIGNELYRGVSGGERKRTNVGVEMMSNPSLVFLDEATSGLDAFQAQNVMQSLWTLAKRGRTIISTVHQPRSSIYQMFDLLLLLSEGQTMYFGPAKTAVRYFSGLGFPCPEHFNPADFFLDIISMDYRSAEAEQQSRSRVDAFAEAFCAAPSMLEDTPSTSNASLDGVKTQFSFANNWIRQFVVLLRRSCMQGARDVIPLIFSTVLTVFIGLILGLLYMDMDNDQAGIQDRTGILFFITLFACFSNLQPVLDVFPAEQKVVNRERASKSYRVLPYYLAKLISEIPVRALSSLIFASIVYWMAGLNPGAAQFFTFFAIILLESLVAQSFGIMISALVPNEKMAFAVAPGFLVILMLFGGFYINQDSVPDWLMWIKYINFLYYAFSAFMVNEFQDACCWTCDKECVQWNTSTGVCTSRGSEDAGGCLSTGNMILTRYGFGSWSVWAGCVGLLGCLLVQHFLGYMLLRFRKPRTMPLNNAVSDDSLKQPQRSIAHSTPAVASVEMQA